MAGEINRVPRALLSLLDMKARGQNPRQLSDTLGGSIELLPLYLQDTRQDRRETVTMNARGFWSGPNLIVPQNQLWWVHGLYAIGPAAGLAAGTSIYGRMAIETPASPINRKAVGIQEQYTAGFTAAWKADELPLILVPGSYAGFMCTGITLGVGPVMDIVCDCSPLEL